MEHLNITAAQYQRGLGDTEDQSIQATIEGQEMSVPLDPSNRHYAEILRQVEAGELTIQGADQP